MLKSVCRVWFVTYRGAFVMALRILDWDLCILTMLDLLAQPQNSVNGEMRGFWCAVLPFLGLVYSLRISQECETKVKDNLNRRRIRGIKPREYTVSMFIFSHFGWLSYLFNKLTSC